MTINGTIQPGQTLTANVSGITPTGATLRYQWQVAGVNAGTSSTYAIQTADAGKTITVTGTGTGSYTGSVASAATTAVPYTVKLSVSGKAGADAVSFSNSASVLETTAIDGSVTIYYTLANTQANNRLDFSGVTVSPATVNTAGTGTATYTVAGTNATDGVITINAAFTHSAATPLDAPTSVTFSKTGAISFSAGANNEAASATYTYTLYKDGTAVTGYTNQTIASGGATVSALATEMLKADGAYTVKVTAHTTVPGYASASSEAASGAVNVYKVDVTITGASGTESVYGENSDFTVYKFSGESLTLYAVIDANRKVTWSGGAGIGNSSQYFITSVTQNSTVTATFSAKIAQTITKSTYDKVTPIVGEYITSTNGSYTANDGGTAVTHTYQWKRSDSADRTGNLTNLVTTQNYTPVAADFGRYIWLETTPVGNGTMTRTAVQGNVLQVSVKLTTVVTGAGGGSATVNSTDGASGVIVYGQANIAVSRSTSTDTIAWTSNSSGTFGSTTAETSTYTPTGASGTVTLTATPTYTTTIIIPQVNSHDPASASGLTATNPMAIEIPASDTAAKTFDLSIVVLNMTDCGTVSYSLGTLTNNDSILIGNPSLSGENNKTLHYTGNGKTSGSATQVITITTANYQDTTVTITFNATTAAPGSAGNLFEVTSEADLRHVGRENYDSADTKYVGWTLTAHYIQTAPITMQNVNSTPIGDNSTYSAASQFTGSYDGGRYSITGLTVSGGNYQGMFGLISTGGTVQNVGLEGVSITGTGSNIGGVVGTNYESIVQNCYTTCDVRGNSGVGGVVGENSSSGTLINCVALNKSVTAAANAATVGRVVGGGTGTLTNNYAWSGTTVKYDTNGTATGKTLAEGTDAVDGASLMATEIKTATTWAMEGDWNTTDPAFAWDFTGTWVWDDGGANMPSLKNVGTAQTWPIHLFDVPTDPGNGSEQNPFKVYDVTTLKKVGSETGTGWTLDAYYEQINNIDMSGVSDWVPIGYEWDSSYWTVNDGFTGVYDGNNKTIANLTISDPNDEFWWDGAGLFVQIAEGGLVKNLELTGVDILVDDYYIGGIVGYLDTGTVENCSVTGSVTGKKYTGGIAGCIDNGTVENCYVIGSITGGDHTGGIVGYSEESTIINCGSSAAVTGDVTCDVDTGGVVGNNAIDGTVENCYATGNVTGIAYVGGVAGSNSYLLENCYATGNVTGESNVGGVAGKSIVARFKTASR